jgi:DNA polymerase III subunit gamma/tau
MFSITERPESFDEVVGNQSIVDSLKAMVASETRPHVYMIHGPSGVGKTTLARICAYELGAEGMGIQERNVSNETGVDSARDLTVDASMMPMEGKAKVYILDEVDKASDSWQSAMKKPLEDTPRMTYYFLLTENPSKLKKAIHTRSAKFKLNALTDEDLLYLIKRIARKHKKKVEQEVYDTIIEYAEGSARSAVIALEQVMDVEDPEEAKSVIVTEGASPEVRELCQKLLKNASWKEVSKIIKGLKEEPESVRRAVLGYMNAVLLNSGMDRAFDIIDVFRDPLYNSGKAGLTAMCYEVCE